MNRLHRIPVLFAILGFVLFFSSWHPANSAPPSPRDNPEFWDKLSGVVVVDPTWTNPQSFHLPSLIDIFPGVLNLLEDIPVGPNVLCNQDLTTQAQNEPRRRVRRRP